MNKKTVLTVVAVMLTLASCISINSGNSDSGSVFSGGSAISPSETMATRTLNLGDFHEIEASRVDVVYSIGNPGHAVLTAPDNIIDLLTVKTSGGKLKVCLPDKENVNGSLNATLTVSSRSIDEIEATLSAKVKVVAAVVNAGDVELDVSTSAVIELPEVTCGKIDVDASTSGCVKISKLICSGTVDLEASTSSAVNIDTIEAKRLEAEASTSAVVKIGEGKVGTVDLDASTSGVVRNKCSYNGGTATATTGGLVETDTAKLTSRSESTGGRISSR